MKLVHRSSFASMMAYWGGSFCKVLGLVAAGTGFPQLILRVGIVLWARLS